MKSKTEVSANLAHLTAWKRLWERLLRSTSAEPTQTKTQLNKDTTPAAMDKGNAQ